jgi:nucleoside-diphosphate-sugar epimerase
LSNLSFLKVEETDKPKLVLVTGASGFVGNAVVAQLELLSSYSVRSAVRRADALARQKNTSVVVCDLAPSADWTPALTGVNIVVHTAARVHSMAEQANDCLDDFRQINVEGTLNFARQAARAGVQRFIFISSVKVMGETSTLDHPFCEEDQYAPQSAYAISKMEAEQGLRAISSGSAMELVIIRSPMVYGRGVRANFMALVHAVERGIPLPFGIVHNRRSLIALDNLVNFVLLCLEHSRAANQTFMVSDAEDLSTPELVRRVGATMNKSARLLPVPVSLLHFGAILLRKRDIYQRLCENLQVDISKAQRLLGWSPVVSVDEGLRRATGKRSDG